VRVLDLFSGWGGWSNPWREAGHDVITLDIDQKFSPDLTLNIFDFDPKYHLPEGWVPDVILASPPCDSFTVMRIGRNWTKDHRPKTADASLGLAMVMQTMSLVAELKPQYFILENPRAKLRRIMEIAYPNIERRTVTYCQYGEERMKPTDLWSPRFPATLQLKATCRNGDPCHLRAPRGSRTGTQGGVPGDIAAIIPTELATDVRDAILEETRANPSSH
jgi:hypothetical protein